jgi:adenylate cyclase
MHATVLFADISGGASLVEIAGQAVATKALAQCLQRLTKAAQSAGGKVMRISGDQLMAVFPTPERAAHGAVAMHTTIDALPAVGHLKLAVQVGFHSGPIIQRNQDVLGDTVKLAARLLDEAQKGQTLTSRQTAALLGEGFRSVTSPKSIAPGLEVCEIVARGKLLEPRAAKRQANIVQLSCRDQILSVSREIEMVVIGRERGCGLVVADRMASRRHCTVRLRNDKFLLQDHSANGTLVSIEGQPGVLLKGKELVLRGCGIIIFGPRRFDDSEVIQFRCV